MDGFGCSSILFGFSALRNKLIFMSTCRLFLWSVLRASPTLSLVNDFDGTRNREMIENMLKKKDDDFFQEPTFATPVQDKNQSPMPLGKSAVLYPYTY